jgi:hypothetical protein
MTMPDGRVKDGFFENNNFKGTTQMAPGAEAPK